MPTTQKLKAVQRDKRQWSMDERGDAMIANYAQETEAIPRTFAEFPSADWTDILNHARQLHGVSNVGLFGEGDDRTWVCFEYRNCTFCVVSAVNGSRVTLDVDNARCPARILLEVQQHFAALLLPASAG